jgi:plasmid maintenance system antidote protein VapI
MTENNHKLHEFKPDWALRPGVALAEIITERQLTPEEAASATGLTAETLTGIMYGTITIDQQTAGALHAGLGVSAQFWLNYQANYEADLLRGATDSSEEYEAGFPWPRGETPIVTKTGRVLTDADINALADEAEKGYDPATIRLSAPPATPAMSEPHEYCVVHDQSLNWRKTQGHCRQIMTSWGLYRTEDE